MNFQDSLLTRETRSEAPGERLVQHKQLLLIAVSVAVAIAAGLLAAQQPFLAIAALAAVVILPAVFARPDNATLLVIFLLYSNVVVVAVRFHELPYILGASFPLLLMVPLVVYLVFRRQGIVYYGTFPFLLAFTLVQLLGSLLARDVQTATSNFIVFLTEGVVIYLLVLNVVRTQETLRRATWALLLAAVVLSIFPLHQQFSGNFDTIYGGFAQLSETGFRTGELSLEGEVRQFRAAGAIGEQNRFAQILLMVAPLALYTFSAERSRLLRALALAAAVIVVLATTLTFSRGAAVASALMLIALLLLKIVRPYQALLVLLGTGLVLLIFPQYQARLATLPELATFVTEGPSDQADGSLRGRTTEMLAAALVFADYPLVGVGPGMFKYYSQEYGNVLAIRYLEENREAHSLPLDIAANHGVLGLIAFFGIFYITLRDLARLRERLQDVKPGLAAFCTGYLLALLFYLAVGLFLHLSYIRYLWLMLALGAATVLIGRKVLADFEQRPMESARSLRQLYTSATGGSSE